MSMDAHQGACEIRKRPLERSTNSQAVGRFLGLRRVIDYDFIAPRRSNSAHVWTASAVQEIF